MYIRYKYWVNENGSSILMMSLMKSSTKCCKLFISSLTVGGVFKFLYAYYLQVSKV